MVFQSKPELDFDVDIRRFKLMYWNRKLVKFTGRSVHLCTDTYVCINQSEDLSGSIVHIQSRI